jgi:hypothetical protein
MTPLVAALAGKPEHFQVAQLLHQHGADVDVRGDNEQNSTVFRIENGIS